MVDRRWFTVCVLMLFYAEFWCLLFMVFNSVGIGILSWFDLVLVVQVCLLGVLVCGFETLCVFGCVCMFDFPGWVGFGLYLVL